MAKILPGTLTDGTVPALKCSAALSGSQAAKWGSQAAKAYLFSTFPKLTESTLPGFKSLAAPWESHAPKWGSQAAKAYHPARPSMLRGAPQMLRATLRKPSCQMGKPGCQGLPFFYLSETDGKHPARPQILRGAWRLQFFQRVVLLLTALQTSSATSFQSSVPPHVRELANFLCCMVSPRACYA